MVLTAQLLKAGMQERVRNAASKADLRPQQETGAVAERWVTPWGCWPPTELTVILLGEAAQHLCGCTF